MRALRVPKANAERAKQRIVRLGLFDEARRIARLGDRVEVPLTGAPPDDLVAALDGEVVQEGGRPRTRFRDPHVTVRRQLTGTVPDRLLDALPDGYARLGDVVLVDLPAKLHDHGETVGAALGRALGARAVLDRDGIAGELREPVTRHLWGDPDTETVHREHGIAYGLDPGRVMFSLGNKAERRRILDTDLDGVRVADLFGGVGQFTLPAARAGATVVASEKNPVAAGYLRANAERNGVTDRVEVRTGDCRDVAPAGRADLVVMGLLPDASPFLDVARRALDGPGRVWLHRVCDAGTLPAAPDGWVRRDAWQVKPYGPGRDHVVLDLEGPS